MIDQTLPLHPGVKLAVRAAAPWAWRTPERVAKKLRGFSATEAGSALDMLKAAELTEDPELRRLFFKHAMDEARHAAMFRRAAQRISPTLTRDGSAYAHIPATRQNLLAELGLVPFVAFVHHAESQAQAHFGSLIRHFKDDTHLRDLFTQIEKDERFHTAYSAKILRGWIDQGMAVQVRRARWKIRWQRGWQAWRRWGRRIGDLLTQALLAAVYILVLPPFVLIQRLSEDRNGGFVDGRRRRVDAADLRRQF